jgi:hypothetical protein
VAASCPFPAARHRGGASAGLPAAWQAGLAELQQHMARAGIALSVFGSLAWQA